jgi:hypothetical protein
MRKYENRVLISFNVVCQCALTDYVRVHAISELIVVIYVLFSYHSPLLLTYFRLVGIDERPCNL